MRVEFLNCENEIVRIFNWKEGFYPDSLFVLYRKDTNRVEIKFDTQDLEKNKVDFKIMGSFNRLSPVLGQEIFISENLRCRLVDSSVDKKVPVTAQSTDSDRMWWTSLMIVAIFSFGSVVSLLNLRVDHQELEEELKQHVVKIIKKNPIKQKVVHYNTSFGRKTTKPVQVQKKNINRLGALAAFGSLKKSNQKGGVDVGAINTTAGPGLGGNAGSGGVQTSIYGKGVVSAPVGPGANLKGGGGYGTKGKGGGRAGYGEMSLVGSVGTALIPLGREAIVQGGLDKDLIAQVIQSNMGQVRFCYEQGLQGDPKLSGRVAIDFVINGQGQVSVANLKNTTLHSKIVEDCIVRRLQSWKFPLPEGGVSVKVSYPFLLRRTGKG